MSNLPENAHPMLIEQHQEALVLGLGVTGYSVVRFLRHHGLAVAVMDSRAAPPKAAELARNFPEVATFFGGFDETEIAQHSLLVMSPGIDMAAPEFRQARQAGATLVGDIELFMQSNTQPLIAITGSNGKSTVTTLVGLMCEAAGLKPLVAGNIGFPALDALTNQQNFDVAVLELSSFQLEATSSVPADAATILNISPDHMDRYQSMGDYVLAKARILRGAQRAVLPRHHETFEQITSTGTTVSFGLDEPDNEQSFGVVRSKSARWLVRGDEHLLKLRDLQLLGLHNVENVLAAFALVDFLGLPRKKLAAAAKSFTGLPHRMETVATHNQINWVNDSKATNIGAAATALKSLDKDVIWIAGGQGKGADFGDLQNAITGRIKLLVLFGEDAPLLQDALSNRVEIALVDDMAQAVDLAGERAEQNSVVLLSPACASFDMYQSFAQRGDHFRQLAQAWVEGQE